VCLQRCLLLLCGHGQEILLQEVYAPCLALYHTKPDIFCHISNRFPGFGRFPIHGSTSSFFVESLLMYKRACVQQGAV